MSWFKTKDTFAKSHVFLTGASTGIGLALAREFLLRGASVTIVSRSEKKLSDAVSELEGLIHTTNLSGRLHTISADVTSFAQVTNAIKAAEHKLGPIDVGVCCAGASFPGRFLEQDVQLFEKSIELDYYGSLYVAKALLPDMVSRNKGQILFVASPCASIGFVGYSTYCPAKFAVRGLADVLRNELAGTKVKISLGYPLDTDTPGYATENLTKPAETEAISRFAGGKVYSATEVAKSLVKGLQKGEYHIKTPDFLVNLLLSSTSSTTPRLYPLLVEACLAPLVVLLLAIYRKILDNFVIRHRRES